jgi:hypothetical protein
MASSILFGTPAKPATAFAAVVVQYDWCSQVHPNRGRGPFRPTKRSDLFCLVEITRTSAQSANSPCSAMQMESLPSYPGSLPADDHEPVWRPDEHHGGGNAGTTPGDSSALCRIDKSDRFAWTLPSSTPCCSFSFGMLASSRGHCRTCVFALHYAFLFLCPQNAPSRPRFVA